jgi:diaminopimelate decarboxylase
MWWEVPGHLEVREHGLYVGGLDAENLARDVGTPLYVYDLGGVAANFRRFRDAVTKYADREVGIHYAMKANPNKEILKALRAEGACLDCVSPEEVRLGLKAGFSEEDIIFTGVSVSNSDMRSVLKKKRYQPTINIDSFSQLRRLRQICDEDGYNPLFVPISFRMNPGTGGVGQSWKTITAGPYVFHGDEKTPVKFGIPADEIQRAYEEAVELGFYPDGLSEHVGSNWRTGEQVAEFLKTVDILLEKAGEIEKYLKEMRGLGLEFIDFGGGPGIRYKEEHPEFPLDMYAREIWERVKKSGLTAKKILFEPGRFVVGNAGVYLVEVNTVEDKHGYNFVGVNGGMGQFPRPAMYEAPHEAIVCGNADGKPEVETVVAGNCCETGDLLTRDPVIRDMPEIEEGDIVAFLNAGAYCFSMASNYNSRSKPKEIAVLDGCIV